MNSSKEFAIGLVFILLVLGCKEPHKPCSMKLEVLPLPVTFDVSKDRVSLGKLTVNKDESLHFQQSSNADVAAVAALQSVVKTISESPILGFTYNERTKEMSFSCGGEVARGTPEFAAAVRWHLYSIHFYELKSNPE